VPKHDSTRTDVLTEIVGAVVRYKPDDPQKWQAMTARLRSWFALQTSARSSNPEQQTKTGLGIDLQDGSFDC
jgi:hypothetical protein